MCLRPFQGDSTDTHGKNISKQIIQIQMHFKSLVILFRCSSPSGPPHIFAIHFDLLDKIEVTLEKVHAKQMAMQEKSCQAFKKKSNEGNNRAMQNN